MQKTPLDISVETVNDEAQDQNAPAGLILIPGVRNAPRRPAAPPIPAISISDFQYYAEDWVELAKSKRQSPDTLYGKIDTVKKFVEFLEREGYGQVSAREFKRFISHIANGHEDAEGRFGNPRLRRPASERTIQYYFTYLRGLCHWMMDDDMIPVSDDLMRGVRVGKPTQKVILPFSQNQVEALIAAAENSNNPLRDVALLWFMLDTGARAAEVCGLKMENLLVRSSSGQAKVLGKGRKERVLPFSSVTARALWAYQKRKKHQPGSAVFVAERGTGAGAHLTPNGLGQIFERLGRVADIQGVRCSPHTARHTFAINFIRNGGNTFTLQMMLGHTALHQTQKYVAIANADVVSQQNEFSVADRMKRRHY